MPRARPFPPANGDRNRRHPAHRRLSRRLGRRCRYPALVLLAAASPLAHADGSVRLSGLIDAGVAYVSDAGNTAGHESAWQAKNGDINISRWALSGEEPLSPDLTALFTLTNGFSTMAGTLAQQGRLFGFQSYLGLASKSAGTVTLGRQFDAVVTYVEPFSLGGTGDGGTAFAHPYDNDNLDNYTRTNNSIKYASPELHGFTFGGTYGFSNKAGAFADSREYSVGGGYRYGRLRLGAGYFQFDHASNAASANADGAEPAGAPFNADRQRTWGVGGNYQFERFTVGLVLSETRLDNVTSINNVADTAIALPNDDVRFDNVEVNARYYFTPRWHVSAGYTFTYGRFDTPDGVRYPKWHQVNVLNTYALSTRTDVYAELLYQRANQLEGTGIQGAQISNFSRASGANQLVAALGLRHRF
ncbi:Outer membrane protein (porin) [Paraburkholderia caballeronis]|uniref:Outer membrane protein (Porin) n=1 Tax=Paraburkholderia caballeronis TaxID=416943 RepID=A0A1H7S693_9BURK|nr:putative porin [Paraburkholderia caballeronis]PXW97278.1 putative porin [Paraburkholderia caballeronis]RAJ93798.1 putative porin [Paraburkholderia caballeronis]TDV39041.1 putative porin [Paraburkholderia caballeronis]SED57944.1 Outer membrane protein (porin) [Paraburkholderia caballeronis]